MFSFHAPGKTSLSIQILYLKIATSGSFLQLYPVVGKGGINWLSLDLLSFLLLPHARREPDSSQSETSRTLSPSSSIFLQLFVHRPILHLPAPSQSWPWALPVLVGNN